MNHLQRLGSSTRAKGRNYSTGRAIRGMVMVTILALVGKLLVDYSGVPDTSNTAYAMKAYVQHFEISSPLQMLTILEPTTHTAPVEQLIAESLKSLPLQLFNPATHPICYERVGADIAASMRTM